MAARRSLLFRLRQLHHATLLLAPSQLGNRSVPGFPTRSPKFFCSSSSSETPFASWLQRLKGFFVSQESERPKRNIKRELVPTADQKPLSPSAPPIVATQEQFNLESDAIWAGLPRGGEVIAARSLRKQDILRKLATDSPDGQRLETHHKQEVVKDCECITKDVDDVLGKYEWVKEVSPWMNRLKAEGKPLPKSLEEVEKMMGRHWKAAASVKLSKDGQPSRNSLCPCGSGRKYKRCVTSHPPYPWRPFHV